METVESVTPFTGDTMMPIDWSMTRNGLSLGILHTAQPAGLINQDLVSILILQSSRSVCTCQSSASIKRMVELIKLMTCTCFNVCLQPHSKLLTDLDLAKIDIVASQSIAEELRPDMYFQKFKVSCRLTK